MLFELYCLGISLVQISQSLSKTGWMFVIFPELQGSPMFCLPAEKKDAMPSVDIGTPCWSCQGHAACASFYAAKCVVH